MSASDCDVIIHRFMSSVDGMGTREVQAIMQVEVKTRTGKPPSSQMDTLCKLNLFNGQRETRQGVVRFFGVFFLVMDGTSPDDSERMWWGVIPEASIFTDPKQIQWRPITYFQLVKLLRFDIHPRNLQPNPFRRHHKTREIWETHVMPLGFTIERPVLKRS